MKKDSKEIRYVLPYLLAIVFGIGILTLPAHTYNNGDPYSWREEARSILLHGQLSIDAPLSASYPHPCDFFERGKPCSNFVFNEVTQKYYSRYGSFNGLLGTIPAFAEWAITGELPPFDSPHRFLFLGIFFVLLSMGIAAILYKITGCYTQHIAARVGYVLLAFHTTYLWNYLRTTTSESTQLLLLALSYWFFVRFNRMDTLLERRPLKHLYWAWFALLLLCQTKISYVLLLPLLTAILIIRACKSGLRDKALLIYLFRAAAMPVLIICAVQGAIQTIKFGSPFFSGYHQFHDATIEHGFWQATADFLWGGQGSIFMHFPVLFLALFGMRRFIRRYPDEAWFVAGCMFSIYALTAPAGGAWRGEITYGPRYFAPVLPLFALPALYTLEWMLTGRRSAARISAMAVTVIAVVFMICVQMEINRMDYHFKYMVGPQRTLRGVYLGIDPKAPAEVVNYFYTTPFAKINWDHLQARGHLETLPYYPALAQHVTPDTLKIWNHFVEQNIEVSNLFWFPDINKP